MPFRPLPTFLNAQDVLGNPLDWLRISRDEALRLASRGISVVAVSGNLGAVTPFDSTAPCWHASGPYDYASLRYFAYRPSFGPAQLLGHGPGRPAGRSGAAKARSGVTGAAAGEEAPLEAADEPMEPSAPQGIESRTQARSIGVAREEGLRFDLALDPTTPGLADDVFVLEGLDSGYRQVRTVRDDKVAGDGRLTLIFTEVARGRKYRLSQVQGEVEIILVPEVVYSGPAAPASGSRSKSAPPPAAGQVVGCKAVFRECRIQTESTDLWRMRETQYQFELAYAKDKWVYVFGGPQGGPLSLIAEGLGTADGGFRPVDLKTHRGKNGREASWAASAWITLPLKVNGREWDLYACLSPIPLPWKRIAELEKNPLPRCYKLGDNVGGVCWVPGHVGREVPRLSKARDPRIADPGKDIVMLGLVDYMAEARRRAGIFRKELKPYLENRFDAPIDGAASPEQVARRRKKHVAGLLKVVLEKHPKRRQLQECLALKGAALDQFLRDEDEREIALKKGFSGAAAALVKWMDSPSKMFDSVVADYFADPRVQEHMRKAEEEIAFLTAYFEVSSLTRLFGQRMLDSEESWVNRYLLNPERFQAVREPTIATVEILNWLSGVVIRSQRVKTTTLMTLYDVLLQGVEIRIIDLHANRGKWKISESQGIDWFPDEAKVGRTRGKKEYLQALHGRDRSVAYKVVQLDLASKPFKRLETLTDSKVVQGVLLGLELNNVFLAIRSLNESDKPASFVDLAGIGADALGFFLETAASAGARIGRGALAVIAAGSSIVDYVQAIENAEDAYLQSDYDQMAAQIGMAIGSASMAVGAALVATTVFSTMTAGTSLLAAGLGLSMTGAGSVPGSAIFLIGAVIFAGSSFASAMLIQDDFEIWLAECPFGTMPVWNFPDKSARGHIAVFYELLHPIHLEVRHEYVKGPGRYVLSISGPLNPFTRISLDSFEFVDSQLRSSKILKNEILHDSEGGGYEIISQPGETAEVQLRLSDEACWRAHGTKHPDFDNRFKYCRLDLRIDLYGDEELTLPSRAVRRPIVLPIG